MLEHFFSRAKLIMDKYLLHNINNRRKKLDFISKDITTPTYDE